MSQTPFIKAWLRTSKEPLDISDSIESIRHESDREKGVLAEFKVKSDRTLDLANHPDMVAGAVVVYQFGFIRSLNQTPSKLCRIGNITYDLSQKRVQLLIQAVDKSLEIKKVRSKKVWLKVTLSDIAKAIAENYGLTFRGETTTKIYDSMPQAGRSDWGFLEYVKFLEAENYHIAVDDSFLILEKNQRSKDSAITYIFGENIISARIDLKEISQKQPVTAGLGIDDKTGKPSIPQRVVTTENNEKTDGRFSLNTISKAAVKTGKKVFDFDINKNKIGEHIEDFFGSKDQAENSNRASNMNQVNAEKTLTCDLSIELDVNRKAGEVVTLRLPIEKLSGNWLIESATHSIDKNGGYSELALSKTGTNKPVKASKDVNSEKVNNTEGGDGKGKTRIYFDVNRKFEKIE